MKTIFILIKQHLCDKCQFTPSHAKAVIHTMRAMPSFLKYGKWWAGEVTARTEEQIAELILGAEGIAAKYEAAFILPYQK